MFLFQPPQYLSTESQTWGGGDFLGGKEGECGKILITLQIKTFGPLPLLAFSRIRLFAGACAFGFPPLLWLGF